MPAVVSADTDRLLRFFEGVSELDAGLIAEARALGQSLDRVAASCADYLPAVPRVDRQVGALSSRADDVAAVALAMATGFLRADGDLLTGPGAVWLAGPWGPAGPRAPVGGGGSTLGPLGPLVRFLVGRDGPTGDDLAAIGRSLLRSMSEIGPLFSTSSSLWTLINPVSGWLDITTGQDLAERLVRLPAVDRVLRSLHLGEAAAPWVQRASRSLTVASISAGVKRLIEDGSPLTAWRREGANYISHWAELGFDASSQACSEKPMVPTCGAAVVTGLGWAGLEIYERRKTIRRWAQTAVSEAPIVAGALRQFVAQQLRSIDDGADAVIDDGASRLDDLIRELERGRGPIHVPAFAAKGAEHVVERARQGAHTVKDGAVRAARAAGREVRDDAEAVLHGGATLLHAAVEIF